MSLGNLFLERSQELQRWHGTSGHLAQKGWARHALRSLRRFLCTTQGKTFAMPQLDLPQLGSEADIAIVSTSIIEANSTTCRTQPQETYFDMKSRRTRKTDGPQLGIRPNPCDQKLCGLRTRRPPTGVFGPFGPEVPLGVSERVSPKIGVCPKVSGEVPLGPF